MIRHLSSISRFQIHHCTCQGQREKYCQKCHYVSCDLCNTSLCPKCLSPDIVDVHDRYNYELNYRETPIVLPPWDKPDTTSTTLTRTGSGLYHWNGKEHIRIPEGVLTSHPTVESSPISDKKEINTPQFSLGTKDGQLHLLLPAGVGDIYWAWCKWGVITKDRKVKVWLPAGEQNRGHQLCSLLNIECGYLDRLTTPWVWSQPSEPLIPKDGAVLTVQVNTHLEQGKRIEDWYSEVPIEYPEFQIEKEPDTHKPYILVFMAAEHYMGGNFSIPVWQQLLKSLQKVIEIRIIAAGRDVPFAQEVLKPLKTILPHLFDKTLEDVLVAGRNALCSFGLASGPLILLRNTFCPTYMIYPDHLKEMIGSWERPDSKGISTIKSEFVKDELLPIVQSLAK